MLQSLLITLFPKSFAYHAHFLDMQYADKFCRLLYIITVKDEALLGLDNIAFNEAAQCNPEHI